MERGLSDASLLSRRRSSRLEQLERASSAYTPSLSFIGNGGTSTVACGSINNNLTSFASMTSIPALSSVASVSGSKILSGASYRTTQEDDEIMHATEDDDAEEEKDASDAAAAMATYRRNAIVLPLLHFVIGVVNNLQAVAWREYLIHGANFGAGLNPSDQALLSGVVCSLPWNLKIIVAFISDVQPICGYRRKSYLLLGLLVQAGGWCALGVLGSNASLPIIAAQEFAVTFGQMTTGVMCDALVVEGVACEKGSEIGKLQTSTQIFFAAGGLLGTALAGVLPQYGHLSNEAIFLARGIAALATGLAAVLVVREKRPSMRPQPAAATEAPTAATPQSSVGAAPTVHADGGGAEAEVEAAPAGGPIATKDEKTRQRCPVVRSAFASVWQTMCLHRVFRPLIFIFAFAAAPNSSDAFNTYLLQQTPMCRLDNATGVCLDAHNATSSGDPNAPIASYCAGFSSSAAACDRQWGGLEFDQTTYAAIGLLGSFGSVLGNYIFRRFLLAAPWHGLFATTVCLAAGASALQLLLMFRADADGGKTVSERIHVPDVAFALGDDVIVAVANQLLAMPILILMARLCPEGAEGTTYALVSSVQMSGGTVGGIFSQIATAAFGVTNTDFSRLWQLTLLTSTAKLTALLFLPLVPADGGRAAMAAGRGNGGERSSLAGFVILALFSGGLIWAFVQIGLALAAQA